jgi:hypothetical protein
MRQSVSSAISFVKRHPLSGFDWGHPVETRPGPAANWTRLQFGGSITGGHPPWAGLTFWFVPSNGLTVIRIDAQVAWIYPRSPREVIPAAVSKIGVRYGQHARRVTSPSKVSAIVRWFDALNVVQPDIAVYGCPYIDYVPVGFVFRSAQGAVLATATVPSLGGASWCNQIKFSIGGHQQTPLIDSTPFQGKAFIDRVQRLLSVRFVR